MAGAVRIANAQAAADRVGARLLQFLKSEFRKELLRRLIVVVSLIGPEKLGERQNLRRDFGLDSLRMRHQRFEQPFLAEAVARQLIVNDGIDGNRGLAQPIGQRLLARRQFVETVRFELHEAGRAYALDQRTRRIRALRARRAATLAATGQTEYRHDKRNV